MTDTLTETLYRLETLYLYVNMPLMISHIYYMAPLHPICPHSQGALFEMSYPSFVYPPAHSVFLGFL
jgi:hypothetical protein